MILEQRELVLLDKFLHGSHFLSSQELSEELGVSEQSIIIINRWLRENGFGELLYVPGAGYGIHSAEKQKIAATLYDRMSIHHHLFDHADLDAVYEVIHHAEISAGIRLSEEMVQTLSVHLFLMIKLFTHDKGVVLDPVEKMVIQETKEYHGALTICEGLEAQFHLDLPPDEVYYVAAYLLKAKMGEYTPDNLKVEHLTDLRQAISAMVDDFQIHACLIFKNRRELEQDLFYHLKPTFYRMKYGILLENPLSQMMHVDYSDYILLTKKVVHHFEYLLGKRLPDGEIAYIAMHFGGWLDREGARLEPRKKAVIVSPGDQEPCKFLQKQIEDLVSCLDIVDIITVDRYLNSELIGIDYVFTTVPLEKRTTPVFLINAVLSNQEKADLFSWLCGAGTTTLKEFNKAPANT